MKAWRSVLGYICEIYGGKAEPSLLEMHNASRARQGPGQGSPDLLSGEWKHEKSECMVILSVNKSEWSCMQTISAGFRKWENMHACEVGHHNDDCLCKNSVMHVTTVRCKRKQKWRFYKLTYIKTTTSAPWNQADITYIKWNTKRDRNAVQDTRSRLTLKQVNWKCWRLLDVMWDVRDTRSMWGMRSAASGS